MILSLLAAVKRREHLGLRVARKMHGRHPLFVHELEQADQRVSMLVLGVNSIDILNFGRKTGHKIGPGSGPNSVLGHYKFRHLLKLQT